MLEDKIAIVTGAGRGIGKAIAIALADKGATVIINYCGSEDKAREVTQLIRTKGQKAESYQCDVSDYQATAKMIKDIIAEYGQIDILVNNAGITKDNLIVKMKEEEFDQVIDINLKGTFNTIRHITRQMLKQRSGKIINITSVSGILGNAGQVNYAASKAGVIGITKSVARELASRGININAVAPGYIETEMTEAIPESINVIDQIPFKRYGNPKDVANAVVFLASDDASYITGQVIHVDGGMAI